MSENFYLCSIKDINNLKDIINYNYIFNVKFITTNELKIKSIIYSTENFIRKNTTEYKNELLTTSPFIRPGTILKLNNPIDFNKNVFMELENNTIEYYKSNRFMSYKLLPFELDSLKCFKNLDFLNMKIETNTMMVNNEFKIINSIVFLENLLEELDEENINKDYYSCKILNFLDFIDS